jgi:hypothetical protein
MLDHVLKYIGEDRNGVSRAGLSISEGIDQRVGNGY